MGSSTIIDMLASTVIAGMLMLNIFRVSLDVSKESATRGSDMVTQENLVTLARIVETDFRRLGFNADSSQLLDPSKAILSADSSSITFIGDIDKNGSIDTLTYSGGTVADLPNTPNPRDLPIYRKTNSNGRQPMNLGLTKFRFSYLDANDNELEFPITTLGAIFSIRLSVAIENPYAIDQTYVQSYWGQLRLATRNLKNR